MLTISFGCMTTFPGVQYIQPFQEMEINNRVYVKALDSNSGSIATIFEVVVFVKLNVRMLRGCGERMWASKSKILFAHFYET